MCMHYTAEMFPIFLFSGLALILCSLVPPVMSFSHGASNASCREMVPGHIRAHPLDPRYSHIGLRTSASSYLPGQLITVTVRGSRDFMGFLLQARSVDVTRSSAGGHAGLTSTSPGLLLVGGSWILTPPGTHTLHCFSEGDTVTHSDKQRKRNLSFLWRAPDAPMGDVRFHITVVQSYFVYWAGIESAVVHDGSRSAWRGSNTTLVDGASTLFVSKDEKVTSLQGLKAHKVSKKERTRTASPAAALGQPTKTTRRTQITKSLKTFADINRPALKSNSSVTLSNHASSKRSILTFGSNQSNTNVTPEFLPSVSEETTNDPVSHSDDTKMTLPFTASISPADVGTDASITLFSNTTEQISTRPLSQPNSPVPLFPLNDVETERKDPTITPLEQKLNTDPELKDETLTLETTISHDFHGTSTPSTTKQRSPAKLETSSRPEELHEATSTEMSTHSQTSSSKPGLQSNPDRREGSLSSRSPPKSPTSPPKVVLPSKSTTLKSFPVSFFTQAKHQSDKYPSGPKSTTKQTNLSQTTTPLNTSQSLSSFYQNITETIPSQDEAVTPSSVTPHPLNTHFFTSRPDPLSTPENDLKSQSKSKTTSPGFDFVLSATSSPSFSTFPHFDSSSSPATDSFHTSVIHPRSAAPLHLSRGSTLVSMHPSARPTSLTHSSSSSLKSQHRTAPALSAPHSPSPVFTPPHLSSVQPSSTSPPPSFLTSSSISSTNTTGYPLQASLFSPIPVSTSPPFNSSQCIANVTSPSSTSAMASAVTSSSSPSSIFSPTSTSSAFSEGSSSSFTSPDRPLHTPPTSSVPSQKITVSQTLQIETHMTPTRSEPDLNPPTQRTVVHPNPKPHPNLRLNPGHEFKTKILSSDTKPSNPAETPNEEGKYPEIIPRHSSWELGMLLGCSAGLGMVLVIGVRYVYRQACGRRTGVTLNDREREYDRGDRGLIQVQECGDLVRVRKIRENSFVLLTEYDVLTSPGH